MDIYNIVSIAIICLVVFMIFTFKFKLPSKQDFSKAKETLSEDNKKIIFLIAQAKLANQKKIFTLYLIKKTQAKIAYLNVLIAFIKNIKTKNSTLMIQQMNILKKRINLQVNAIKFYIARTKTFISQTTNIFYQLEQNYKSIINKISMAPSPKLVQVPALKPVLLSASLPVSESKPVQLPVLKSVSLPASETESETPETESETPETETPESETSESQTETPDSQSETPDSQSETPESETETPDSQLETDSGSETGSESDSVDEDVNEGFRSVSNQIKIPDKSSLPKLDPNELVLPVFDESVLSQIPNVQNVPVELKLELEFLKSLPIEKIVEIPKNVLVSPEDIAEERKIYYSFTLTEKFDTSQEITEEITREITKEELLHGENFKLVQFNKISNYLCIGNGNVGNLQGFLKFGNIDSENNIFKVKYDEIKKIFKLTINNLSICKNNVKGTYQYTIVTRENKCDRSLDLFLVFNDNNNPTHCYIGVYVKTKHYDFIYLTQYVNNSRRSANKSALQFDKDINIAMKLKLVHV